MLATQEWLYAHNEGLNLHEANDCSVIALTVMTNHPYHYVQQALEFVGRERRQGCTPRQFERAAALLGLRLTRLTPLQAYQAMSNHEPMFLLTADHVFAVKDGRTHDPKPLYAYDFVGAYRVTRQ